MWTIYMISSGIKSIMDDNNTNDFGGIYGIIVNHLKII